MTRQYREQEIELQETKLELATVKENLRKKKKKKKSKEKEVRKTWIELGTKQATRILKPVIEDLNTLATQRETRYLLQLNFSGHIN